MLIIYLHYQESEENTVSSWYLQASKIQHLSNVIPARVMKKIDAFIYWFQPLFIIWCVN